MSQYTFKINDEYGTIEAFDLDDALKEAEIGENDDHEIIEVDDFENKCLVSAITNEILFGS